MNLEFNIDDDSEYQPLDKWLKENENRFYHSRDDFEKRNSENYDFFNDYKEYN